MAIRGSDVTPPAPVASTTMATIDHVTIRVGDLADSLAFYTRVFELLDYEGARYEDEGFFEWNDFSIAEADAERPPTTGLHIAFAATSREQIATWWNELTSAGYADDGAPGPRPEYGPSYFGAFVKDGDGNSVEAVLHETTRREPGLVDHLWIRVHDVEQTRLLYTALAPILGLRAQDRIGRLQLVAEGATFSFLQGEQPTRNLHLAVGVPDTDTVRRFHMAGVQAGAVDNGPPGERPQYHPGYYGAFLYDPDGTNLEAVHHGRAA